MGIKLDIVLDIGLELKGAYSRIDTVSGYKGNIDISLNTYVSREAFINGSSYVEQKRISFKPSVDTGSENFIRQAYEYLKNLPEFKDAQNVPENGDPD